MAAHDEVEAVVAAYDKVEAVVTVQGTAAGSNNSLPVTQ